MNARARNKPSQRRRTRAQTRHPPGQLLQLMQRALCAFFIFTLPVLLYLGNTEYGYTKTMYAYLMIALLYLLWGLQAWSENEWRFYRPVMLWPALGLLVAGGLSIVNATSPGIVLQSLGVLLYFCLFYVYLANQTVTKQTMCLFVGAGLLAAFMTSVYGLFQFFELAPGLVGTNGGKHAMLSSFGNKNYLAEMLAIWILPSLLLMLALRNAWAKSAMVLINALNFVVFVLADSTGALLGLVAGGGALAVGALMWSRSREQLWAQKIWVGAWLVLMVAPLFFLDKPDLLEDLLSQTEVQTAAVITTSQELPPNALSQAWVDGPTEVLGGVPSLSLMQGPLDQIGALFSRYWQAGSGNVRAWDWWVALEMFNEHPWFGIGLGHYKVLFVEYKGKFLQTERGEAFDFYIDRAAQAHNDYLQAAAELGVVGIVTIVLAFGTLLWHTLRQTPRVKGFGQLAALLLVASAVVFFVDAVVNFPAHLAGSAFSVVLVLGLAHGAWTNHKPPVQAKGSVMRVLVVLVVLMNFGVNVFAYRDWQANVHLDEGKALLNQGLYALARESFEKSLLLDFQPAEVLWRLGTVYQQLGELEKAESLYERSMQSFLVDEVYYPLAVLKVNANKYDEAEALLDQLVLSQPRESLMLEAELLRANIQLRLGNTLQAITMIEALRDRFNQPKTIYWLGRAKLANREFDEGVSLLREALARVENSIVSLEAQRDALVGQTVSTATANEILNGLQFNVQFRQQILDFMAQIGIE